MHLKKTTAQRSLLAASLALAVAGCQSAPFEAAGEMPKIPGPIDHTPIDHHGKIDHGAFIPAGPVTSVAKFDPSKTRLRIDVPGDDDQHILSTIGSAVLGKDAAGNPVPINWHITKGSATLTVKNPDGSTYDLVCDPKVVTTGCPALVTGAITDPLTGELGVAIGNTSGFGTVGDIIEIIWPNLAGGAVPPGPPIVRVQLASWSQVYPTVQQGQVVGETVHLEALDPTGRTYVWDWNGSNPDGTPALMTIPTSPDGNVIAPSPKPIAPPPAGTLPPASTTPVKLNINNPQITQLRANNRLRVDMTAISPTKSPSLKDIGTLAAANPQSILLKGDATVTVNGTTTSIINVPRTTTLVPSINVPVMPVPPTGELGVVLGNDPTLAGDFMEIIWPTLTGGAVAGVDPVVRVQLADWVFPTANTPKLDVHFNIRSFTPDGLTALTTWHGDAIGANVR